MANPCPDSPWCVKQLELDSLSVPTQSIEPGSLVHVRVVVKNHAQLIDITDPDRCTVGDPLPGNFGYRARVSIDVPAMPHRESVTDCYNIGSVAPGVHEVWFSFAAPPNDTTNHVDYDITATLELDGSGRETRERSESFTVAPTGEGSEGPLPPGEDESDEDPLADLERVAKWGVAILGLLIVLKVLDTGGDLLN